jgi:hypothetical protein
MPDDELTWYFAYGSNMASRVITGRRGVTPISTERARLDGYRLVFDMRGIPLLEPGFASIALSAGDCVHGVLYRLTRASLTRIDRSEGAAYRSIGVGVVGERSGEVVASAYANSRPVAGLRPSRRYMRLICEGAREAGLPADYVAKLEAEPTVHVPIVSQTAELAFRTLFLVKRRFR